MNNFICIILGGYVNGYSIIQELAENGVRNIVLIDDKKDVAWHSHLLSKCICISDFENPHFLREALISLGINDQKLIIYPTKDEHLDALSQIYSEISCFAYMGFDVKTVRDYQSKKIQYQFCEKLGVPYPKTCFVKTTKDIDLIDTLRFPILIKPSKSINEIRNFIVENIDEFNKQRKTIEFYLSKDVEFLFSEMIPGAGDQIYAYMAYVDKKNNILGEWTGKKLAQFPNNFGVFSSAMAVDNEEVMNLGRKLVQGMRLTGIVEPEFKYDARDGKYKLMEINLRSMMWNRVGAINGMPLHYIQYLDAAQQAMPKFIFKPQDKHYVYLQYEFLNLILRKGYRNIYKFNLFGGKEREFALCQKGDMRTFIRGWILLIEKIIKKSHKYLHK